MLELTVANTQFIYIIQVSQNERLQQWKKINYSVSVLNYLISQGVTCKSISSQVFAIVNTPLLFEQAIDDERLLCYENKYGQILFESKSRLNFQIRLINYLREHHSELFKKECDGIFTAKVSNIHTQRYISCPNCGSTVYETMGAFENNIYECEDCNTKFRTK